jgi:hypothetical protein
MGGEQMLSDADNQEGNSRTKKKAREKLSVPSFFSPSFFPCTVHSGED